MLTPAKYWRVACQLDIEISQPAFSFPLPADLASYKSPPAMGHGITIAAYDETSQTGILRWIGVIISTSGSTCHIEWKPTSAQIWVDTGTGRGRWKTGAFGFAPKKISNYGLHELWSCHFPDLQLRDHAKMADTPKVSSESRINGVDPQRLNPLEVVGEPYRGTKSGVVYLLKSAYGYKVGRTRNVPNRMRAFGVKLPFIYTIPLVAWFEDCHAAESRYHQRFAGKRINGEWFDLNDSDIQSIRLRV
ncbi:GIY-YIG nuclease family protein [Pseudomonas alliivorans]|nr:GIY-YIG nuclease family protein [Pseudomonas alliivorans]MEE5098352.1 GIY-YIG nuclease family protein [Pseudomonas alliivorans]